MSNRPPATSSKEMTAVIVNLKEARILEKSVQTLSLEESYASKLLDLNSKMVNFNYRRLKNNVNKIRTFLKPQDVTVLRSLDAEGKLQTDHPMVASGSSASKIEAAKRRLKLNDSKRAVSAMARIGSNKPREKENLELNSVSSFAKDEPQFSCSRRVPRPKTSMTMTIPEEDRESVASKTSRCSTARRPRTSFEVTAMLKSQKKAMAQPIKTTYSCHDEKPVTQNEDGTDRGVLDVFGPNPYEVRRKRLLEVEGSAFRGLSGKKDDFIGDVKQFVKDNPCISDMRPEMTEEIIKSIDSMAARQGKNSEQNLKRQMDELRKTRYLRLSDESIDNSGVLTNAKELINKSNAWKHSIYSNKDDNELVRFGKNIDYSLLNRVIYTENPRERDYYTLKLIRKGRPREPGLEDLFVPQVFKENEANA